MSGLTSSTVDKNVSDISPDQRNTLQDLIGGNIVAGQRVFIMAYNPSTEPNEADRTQGRKKALELLQQAHKNSSSLDLPDSEISDVLREATEAAKK